MYDSSHLGHARTYIVADLIRCAARFDNFDNFFVMNITDIDDKIINRATNDSIDWKTLAGQQEHDFFRQMQRLNVDLPDTIIRVSQVLDKIIIYIQKIIDNGFAYVTSTGSVYFDTSAYINAGYQWTDTSVEISSDPTSEKHSAVDFALWKGRDEPQVGFEHI